MTPISTDDSIRERTAANTARRTGPSSVRSLAAIGLTALVVWGGLTLAFQAFVALIFGGILGLLLVPVYLAGTVALVVLISWKFTGRRRIAAAITVTIAAVVSLALAFGEFSTIPMIWVQPGFELVNLLVAIAAALLLGAFIGPLWLRVIGGASAVAIVFFWCLALAPEQEPVPDQPISLDAEYDAFADWNSLSLVSAVPGSSLMSLESFGSPAHVSWIRTADDGVLSISVDITGPGQEIAHVYPCWMISDNNMDLTPEDTIADYSDWCVSTDYGWARVDGMGFVRLDGTTLIAVRSVESTQIASIGDGQGHPATGAEVAAAFDALRPITDEELRGYFLQTVHPEADEPAPVEF
jgi:hypothetical protein